MTATARIIADSVNPAGQRLATVQVRYWRAVHAELMTHRAFSRNASSSRAIPVRKMLAQVWGDPAGPLHWGANQPGMQAGQELTGWRRSAAQRLWRLSGRVMCAAACTRSIAQFQIEVSNIATIRQMKSVTAMPPTITSARDGSQAPARSRKPSTLAGLLMPATMRPTPKMSPATSAPASGIRGLRPEAAGALTARPR